MRLPEAASVGIQPNQVAGTILLYLPLLYSLLIGWRSAQHRKTALFLLTPIAILTTLVLVLTQSRGGWISGLAGLIVLVFLWAWLKLPRKWVVLVLLAFTTIGIIGLVTIGPQTILNIWLDPPNDSIIGRLNSLGFRQEVWRWAVTSIRDFPFTGTGLGSFRRVVMRLYPIDIPPTYDIAHAHNIFLQTALDIGLPGLVAYIAMLLLLGLLSWQVAHRNENLRPFALGLLAGLGAFHVYGLNDALALGSKTAVLFWLALGLITAMHKITQPANR
jgi:putative inorganic carbon (HCO3(-)) transporter